jgi:ribose-phosphate pyrophosphokinase
VVPFAIQLTASFVRLGWPHGERTQTQFERPIGHHRSVRPSLRFNFMNSIVVACSGARSLGAAVAQHLSCGAVEVQVGQYSDATVGVALSDNDVAAVRGRDAVLIQSFYPDPTCRLYETLLVGELLGRAGVSRLLCVFPYLPFARSDRSKAGESLPIDVVAKTLHSVGIDEILTIDIHSMRAAGNFAPSLRLVSHKSVFEDALHSDLVKRWRPNVVVSGDAGSAKRAAAIAELLKLDATILSKRRAPNTNRVTISGSNTKIGPLSRAIIVDDASITGSTLSETRRWLIDHGVTVVGALVTHWHDTADDQLLGLNVATTNSLPQRSFQSKHVVDISILLAEAVLEWVQKQS